MQIHQPHPELPLHIHLRSSQLNQQRLYHGYPNFARTEYALGRKLLDSLIYTSILYWPPVRLDHPDEMEIWIMFSVDYLLKAIVMWRTGWTGKAPGKCQHKRVSLS